MRAEKDNKVYQISRTQMAQYQSAGFDIYGDDGSVVAYGKNQAVKRDDYERLKKELAKAKADLTAAREAASEAGKQNKDKLLPQILTAYARDHDIDVGNATSVAGLIKKIKACMAEVEGDDDNQPQNTGEDE